MTKSQALVLQSNSHKKKKLKPKVEEITCVQDERKEEMNGKKKKKKSKADDEVCKETENIQMIQSTETNTEICKHKKKKSKAEVLETSPQLNGDHEEKTRKKKKKAKVCVPVENITEEPQETEPMEETHKQEDHMKKKKRKRTDSEAVVPESDPVTPQTNTHTAEEKKQKKRKKSTAESSGDVNTSVQQEPSGVEDEEGEEEEELSPEERRVLERKLKKILKKEEKKKLKEEGKSVKSEKAKTNVAEKQALEYLACWSKTREAWKFNKSRQTWLLQHMYDSVKVSDDNFEMLLPYIDSLKGLARSSTLQKAEVIMRWEAQGEEEDTADAEKKQLRAKQVVQML